MSGTEREDGFESLYETVLRQGIDETWGVDSTIGQQMLAQAMTFIPASGEVSSASFGPAPLPVSALPRLAISEDEEGDADFTITGNLGQGGMGRVDLARQHALRREVAVKSAHEDAPSHANALLREALFTGFLEHPNIIPVHQLGRTEDGLPVIVMKRVSGLAWKDLLDDPEHPHWTHLPEDRMRFNLETLIHVSNALEFAHSRGIIHRDIKPENVMLGRFGEVYLLDWGLAMRPEDPREWPENAQAQTGLQTCIEAVLENALAQKRLGLAQTLVSELPESRAELEGRVTELARELEGTAQEHERLQQLEAELEFRVASQQRSLFIFLAGLVMGGVTVASSFIDTYAHSALRFIMSMTVIAVLYGLGVYAFRSFLLRNRVNRQFVSMTVVGAVSVVLNRIICWQGGTALSTMFTVDMLIICIVIATIAITIDRRSYILIPIGVVFVIAALILPSRALTLQGLMIFVIFSVDAWLWRDDDHRLDRAQGQGL